MAAYHIVSMSLEDGKLRLSADAVAQYMRIMHASQVDCRNQLLRKHLEKVAEEAVRAETKDPQPGDYGIPDWACARSVISLAAKAKNKTPPFVSLRNTAGQTLPMAFMNMIVLWIFYPCYLILIAGVSECGTEDGEKALGVPSYPWWCWAAVLPVVAVSNFLQLSCMRYIILPKQQVLKDFIDETPPGSSALAQGSKALARLGVRTYHFFLIRSMILSSLHVVDVATDSAFVGAIISAYRCAGGESPEMERYWEETLKHSVAARVLPTSWLPGLLVPCVCLWAFGFVVPIYAIFEAMPVWSEWGTIDYEVALGDESKPAKTDYDTYAHAQQNHGAALMIVAEASGMHGIVHRDEDYALKKAELELLNVENNRKELKALEHVQSQARRSVLRTSISGACINCSQLNLQIILLGLSCAITNKKPWDFLQMLLSIIVGAAMTLLRICEACKIIRGLCNGWDERCQGSPAVTNAYKEELKNKIQNFQKWRKALVVMTIICAFWWMYAVLRLCFSFSCSSSLWNLNGCVQLSDEFLQSRNNTKP